MTFVKLDAGILDSSLWADRDQRDMFLTALLMADPYELQSASPQLGAETGERTGWSVPPGWYGLVRAAASGIARRAMLGRKEAMAALRVLGQVDPESRSPEHQGRRLVRIAGGFIVLNFEKYRERDYTAAERSRRWRERNATRVNRDATRNITQAEAEAESVPPLTPPSKEGNGPSGTGRGRTRGRRKRFPEHMRGMPRGSPVCDCEACVAHRATRNGIPPSPGS